MASGEATAPRIAKEKAMPTLRALFASSAFQRTAIPIVAYLVLVCLPTPEGLDPVGQRAFALVVAGILAFSLQPVDIAIAVPFFVLLAVPTGIFTLDKALTSFLGPAFIFVFAMVCLAIAFEKSGLTRRIALWLVANSKGSPKRLLFLFIATATLCSTVLADIPVLVMLTPICFEIINKSGCNVKGSNFAQSLLLGVGSGCFLGGMATPAGSAANPTSIQILSQATGIHISFMEWAAVGMPVAVVLIFVLWLSFLLLMPPEIKKLEGLEHFEQDMAALGSLSRKEKLFLLIFGLTLVLWFTDRLHGISTPITSMIGVMILALPGIEVFSWKRDSHAMNWDAIMLVGGATSFGAMLTSTGVISWFATNYLTGLVSFPFPFLLASICVVMILSQFPIPAGAGAVATLAPAFLAVAEMGGFNPALVIMTVALSQAAPILSPAVCFYPIINSTGIIELRNAWKVGALVCIAEVALIVLSVSTTARFLGIGQ